MKKCYTYSRYQVNSDISYQTGEIPNTSKEVSGPLDSVQSFETPEKAIEDFLTVEKFDNLTDIGLFTLETDPESKAGVIGFRRLLNPKGEIPSKEELMDWSKGDFNLTSAFIYITIFAHEVTQLSMKDLEKLSKKSKKVS